MRLFLGTSEPTWLGRCGFPLMVSQRRLSRLGARWPRARSPWMLDSGGFTELSLFGAWSLSEAEYVARVRRAANEIGRLETVAPMDWMCEPFVLAKTGLSVWQHQKRTVDNFVRLRSLDSSIPFMPVLQGWTVDDYLRCVDLYARAGVDLWRGVVGVGTLCRRQHSDVCGAILGRLHGLGLSLHAFGLKFQGLLRFGGLVFTADTMAWSYNARRNAPLAGCLHRNCNSCLPFARAWRRRLLASL